jgi:hypothetical protein
VKVIFSGSIGRSVTGGQAWANMQYLIGLRELGHDVYYLEDMGEWCWVYDWEAGQMSSELDHPAQFIRDCLEPIGFSHRWLCRAGDHTKGMGLDDFRHICAESELLIVRALPFYTWRDEYSWPRRRVFIDVDPGFTHIRLAQGDRALHDALGRCDVLCTIAQRVGARDCSIPNTGRVWRKTLPPVALGHWPWSDGGPADHFTSIMRWRGLRDIEYEGTTYGQRDREFASFAHLPILVSQRFRVALTGGDPAQLSELGWEVLPGWRVTQTPSCYRTLIANSRAEFGVAKHCYVATWGGWFSDRSVCYLASGRPVLVQDTGLSDWLPTGEGLLTFTDLEDAVQGVERINAAYEKHRRAARQLAQQYFAAERVLTSLLEAALA